MGRKRRYKKATPVCSNRTADKPANLFPRMACYASSNAPLTALPAPEAAVNRPILFDDRKFSKVLK